MNERIAEVGAIVDGQMSYVLGEIARARSALGSDGAGADGPPAPRFVPDSANVAQLMRTLPEKRVEEHSDTMHTQATAALGPAWPTYQRLKFEATVHRLATEVAQRFGFPSESGRANFIDAAIIAWARQHPAWTAEDGARLSALLRPTDAPYRERRLRFILAGINQMYPKANDSASPPRDDLDRLKAAVWTMLEDLRHGTTTVIQHVPNDTLSFLHFTADDDAILANPEDFATQHRREFNALFTSYRDGLQTQLGDGSSQLWTVFQDVTSHGWSENDQHKLLSRYLGFPLWDALIFPTISLTKLPQLTPIEVSQFSPLTATALTAFDENGHETRQAQRHTAAPLRRIPQRDVTRKRLPVGPTGRRRNDPSHATGRSCIQDRAQCCDTTSQYPSPSPGTPGGTRHRDRFDENLHVAGKPAEASHRFRCPNPGTAAAAAGSGRWAVIGCRGGFGVARSARRALNHRVGPQHHTWELVRVGGLSVGSC